MRTIIAIAVSLAIGSAAFAKERVPQASDQECPDKLADLKKAKPEDIKITTLTSGQVHVAQGLFLNTPPLSAGMPPVDGAILLTQRGKKIGKILWIHGDRACGGFDVPMEQVKFVLTINPGKGETIDPDDSDEERNL